MGEGINSKFTAGQRSANERTPVQAILADSKGGIRTALSPYAARLHQSPLATVRSSRRAVLAFFTGTADRVSNYGRPDPPEYLMCVCGDADFAEGTCIMTARGPGT